VEVVGVAAVAVPAKTERDRKIAKYIQKNNLTLTTTIGKQKANTALAALTTNANRAVHKPSHGPLPLSYNETTNKIKEWLSNGHIPLRRSYVPSGH
jgi:hypothetical protein